MDRFVVLALGHGRSPWLGEISRWATSGAIPADLVKCLSVAEVRSRIDDLQRYSALLVDSACPGLDRDLIAKATRRDIPTLVVEVGNSDRDWFEIGAADVVRSVTDPTEFTRLLSNSASVVAAPAISHDALVEETPTWTGRLIGVCGPGGTGASTLAMGLAQGLASRSLDGRLIALADLARNAEQAMLHDAEDVMPAIEELVELHRSRRLATDEVRSLTYSVAERGYSLLLGMRKPSAWNVLPPHAVAAAVDALARSFTTVVADITGDFEGEEETGSADIEERNAMARHVATRADVVVAVGMPGMKGTFSLARLVRSLLNYGVAGSRILAVFNRAPKQGPVRGEMSRALCDLVGSGDAGFAAPIFLPERSLEGALRDGTRLPDQIVNPLTSAVMALLKRNEPSIRPATKAYQRIAPGSLGLKSSS